MFNQKVRNQHRRKLWLRRMPRVAFFGALLLILGYSLASYLSHLPRERFARGYKYFERAWLGAETAARMTHLKLSSRHEDLKHTRLPVAEIYIKGKRYDRLIDGLPLTDVDYEKIKVRVGGKGHSGKARFRGDSLNHWAYPNRSWRVQLEDTKFYRGMQFFNLNVPRSKTQMANWLGYQLGEEFPHLLSPHAENVHFRLNRQFDGVRLLLEQPNQDFFISRHLPPGKLFIGDISSEQIYGGVPRKKLYSELEAWSVRAPGNDAGLDEMGQLLRVVKSDENPYRLFEDLRSIVDINALAELMALLELVGSLHVDDTHNGKFYFHPHLGTFIPLLWDPVAYFWGDKPAFDLGSNRLFRVALSNPEIRHMKDRALWGAMQKNLSAKRIVELIKMEQQRLRGDLYSFPFKIFSNDKATRHISNKEWEHSISDLLKTVKAREQKYRTHISPTTVRFKMKQGDMANELLLGVEVSSAAGFRLDTITLMSDSGVPAVLSREGVMDAGEELRDTTVQSVDVSGKQVFTLGGDLLLSKRRFTRQRGATVVPATYRYRVRFPGTAPSEGVRITLAGVNPVTGESKEFSASSASLKVPSNHKRFSVWWSPESFRKGTVTVLKGDVTLSETKRFGPYDSVRVLPGTSLRMGPGVSILFDRSTSVSIEGTKDRPVKIHSDQEGARWGSIAFRGVLDGNITHLHLDGGSFAMLDHVRYEGSLAVHGGKVRASDLQVKGNYISAKSGTLLLNNSTFYSNFPFAVKTENAVLRERGTVRKHSLVQHERALLDKEGHGTPERVEREFKFSFLGKGLAEKDLRDVADDVRDALEEHVSASKRWSAPKLLQADYYVDKNTEDFLFRDIYYDTAEKLNWRNQISYRYRNRFKSWKAYKNHIKHQSWPRLWPYRLEFQAKVGREELGGGLSRVRESRFEFRKESLPFAPDRLPPDAPWNEEEFMTYFEQGEFQGLVTAPAQTVLRALGEQLPSSATAVRFSPHLVLITERFRNHLNIPSPYGSGPNPEQAFILSLDKTRVYDATLYLEYLEKQRVQIRSARKPDVIGVLYEMEVEFERNVSDILDRQIASAGQAEEKEKLQEVRNAFLADQREIMNVITEELSRSQLKIVPASKSKYVQAAELAALGSVS